MSPTFENGQYLIVDQISYRLGEPKRGDVVIFKYPYGHGEYYIKRIIGLPGETVKIDGENIQIMNKENPEGITLDQSYIKYKKDSFVETVLEDDEYFVMGDNRAASSDSRIWGPLKEEFVTGRAVLRLYPFSLLPGKISQ